MAAVAVGLLAGAVVVAAVAAVGVEDVLDATPLEDFPLWHSDWEQPAARPRPMWGSEPVVVASIGEKPE